MIAHIQFRHMGEEVESLLIFNFAAVRDVIIIKPQEEASLDGWSKDEKENGIVFTQAGEGVWDCPNAAINQFPETFSQLTLALRRYFNENKFRFRMRHSA